jgi:hypothetical protein
MLGSKRSEGQPIIDLNYAEDLEKNLSGYEDIIIIPGKYEDNILKILEGRKSENIFIY